MSIYGCEKCGRPRADVPHFCGRFVYVGRLRDLATASSFREVPPASPLAALKGATERMEKVAVPTPAEMLGEAYALLERARVLALDAYDKMADTPLSRTNGVVLFGDTRRWVEWLKREAEALE